MKQVQLSCLFLTIACLGLVQAQRAAYQGYLTRGSGRPVGITYLTPPIDSPYAGPAQAPVSMTQPMGMAPTSATSGTIGPCFCSALMEDDVRLCYHNTTGIKTNNATVIDTACTPPTNYNCRINTANVAIYGQVGEGTLWRCEAIAAAPGSMMDQQTQYTSSAVQTKDYTGIFPVNYVRPNGSMNLTTARTVVLPQAQLVYINPKPDSLGLHFPGVDITMNGNLNALPLEPPNPAVCVGNGFVMEVTNDVLIVYSQEDGSIVAGPTDFQHFFDIDGPPTAGLSDPYCLYDAADSKRFYVSMSRFSCRTAACLRKDTQPAFSYLLIGVSKTSDPRDGFLGPYWVATDGINSATNRAYPGFGDCDYAPPGYTGKGCLGDFPNPGMDQHGFWFGMNMFTINASVLIGANVFGVRKADLLTGQFKFPSVVTYTDWFPYPGFTIVPAMTQATSNHTRAQNGSIFFMSSDSFSYSGQNNDSRGIPSIRAWAITNTSLLSLNFPNNQTPTIHPPVTMLTEPLQFTSTALRNPSAPSRVSVPQPNGPILGAQEERMRQVAFSGGYLYSCFNNPVVVGSRISQGLAYFVVQPNFTASGQFTATIADQGYVAVGGAHLLNGALTATANGSMVISGSIVGQGMYLSAFYAHITPKYGVGPVRVPRVSLNPLLNEGPGQIPQRRTGDYTTAVLDEDDQVWIVAEWASDNYTNLRQPDSGNPRLANWGTYIMEVNPYVLS